MHIGFIEDTPLHGGTQIWVTEATEKFLAKGEQVTLLAPTGSWMAEECLKRGARVVTYDWDKVTSESEEYEKIWIEALAPCDVAVTTVHPPRNGFHCAVFAGKCIKKGGLDTILIPKTGTIVPEYKREFYLPEESINSTVICITNFTRNYLIDHYKIPAEIVELIYQGTEVDRFTSTDETKKEAFNRYKLPENAGPVLASVGSFEERKGQIILLEAIAELSKGALPNVHAMMVGDGPDEEMLKGKVKEMGLESNVTFFPFTREPNYIFDRIDILTLPSLYKEGLPNVILEAMSMNLPVIASEMAGIPEVVINGETGYMVKPGDVKEFVEAVIKLWESPEVCAQMGKNARKLMEDKMDKKHQFGAFLDYFHRISEK
jgi:glycosyltransferase involved in cell wall biosynthesis